MKSYTLNSLSRWSCKSKPLPEIATIKGIHIYDFDNTLFSSPLPNPQLWSPPTVGLLQTYEVFTHGGWWHDPGILSATGEGIEKEEPRAWEGWWNDVVVQLAEASIEERDTITVLLTGRGEDNFADLINRICNSKKLDFDMVVLKPEVGPDQQSFIHTIDFKQAFLKDLILTYRDADSIRVYEDRVKHVKGFREFLEKLNKSLINPAPSDGFPPRKAITADVVHVCELKSSLDPETEVIAVQTAINRHNKNIRSGGPNPTGSIRKLLQIKDNFLYFGYLISQTDSARLITLCNTPPHLIDTGEVKYMASSILIAPFYPRKDLIDKVGGRGNKVTWQVNGVAKFEDRIWAARVSPVSDKQIHTQDDTPMVVLAIRKGSRQIDAQRIKNWQPVAPEKQFIFETVVGDKVMLKIEDLEIQPTGGDRNGTYHNKRKIGQEDDTRDKENHGNDQGNRNDNHKGGSGRYFHNKPNKGFSNRRNFNSHTQKNDQQGNTRMRTSGAGGGRRGGNRAASGYKSLDDYGGAGGYDGSNDSQAAQGGGAMVMNY